MNLCYPITNQSDLNNLYSHLSNGYIYMAMTNYPYPTSFLEPMPAWPVDVSGAFFENITYPPTIVDWTRKELVLTAVLYSTNVYFSYLNASQCVDFNDVDGTGNLDGAGWNILACN